MPSEQDLKDSISCSDCINAFFHCISPRTQFGHYWREGQFDLCQGPVKEFAFCMKLKFSDKDEAKDMLRELIQEEPSPTIGHIWETRTPVSTAESQKR